MPSDKTALRVAMLTYSFYESDNRVRRYAESLVQRGDSVDIISLRREGQSNYNELNGVRIFRIQERVRDETGKLDHLIRILKFLIRSTYVLTRNHLIKIYDLVHVHSVPDFEVFAALVPKLTGAKIILDIHDIVPELYANKFNVVRTSTPFKALVLIEKLSTKFADHIIASNDLWRKTLCSRSVKYDKCTTILNFPDENLFFKKRNKSNNGSLVFLYPGTLNFHQGLDIAIKAFAKIRNQIGKAELHIIGDGPAKKQLSGLIREFGLQEQVILEEPVPLDEIAKIMAKADIGIIPKRNDDFGGEAFSTKTLEFMSLGVPIIVSRTKIDQYYFSDSIVKFFKPEDINDLAKAMITMVKRKDLRRRFSERAIDFAKMNNWTEKKKIYFDVIKKLCKN